METIRGAETIGCLCWTTTKSKSKIKGLYHIRKEKERRQALQGSWDRLRQQAYTSHIMH
ncbi:hypothetical protein [Paenibacillus sp. A3M_27_13]|uniref:hypothetical protein n=1 Tax=Paenibacillus sp. A3M_27_13 TaxID=2962029 RepID=UPI0020B85840|nr:hypothetical protein [Paenibacillus sp. A3M_27_13]MCP3746246.1 hypothetical protein [Paenibacillus sp. A3M_27_13]